MNTSIFNLDIAAELDSEFFTYKQTEKHLKGIYGTALLLSARVYDGLRHYINLRLLYRGGKFGHDILHNLILRPAVSSDLFIDCDSFADADACFSLSLGLRNSLNFSGVLQRALIVCLTLIALNLDIDV